MFEVAAQLVDATRRTIGQTRRQSDSCPSCYGENRSMAVVRDAVEWLAPTTSTHGAPDTRQACLCAPDVRQETINSVVMLHVPRWCAICYSSVWHRANRQLCFAAHCARSTTHAPPQQHQTDVHRYRRWHAMLSLRQTATMLAMQHEPRRHWQPAVLASEWHLRVDRIVCLYRDTLTTSAVA